MKLKIYVEIMLTLLVFLFIVACNNKTTEPKQDPLNLNLVPTHASVFAASDGSIDLTVIGGEPPFEYQWSTGATTEDVSGLSAGLYSVTVTDDSDQIETDSTTLTEPDEVELTIEEKLNNLEGVVVMEIPPQNGFTRQFEIYVSQKLDHNNPNSTHFNQRLYLSHRDETAPMVFMPSGYSNRATTASELSEILNANQIYVAHRFMAGAKPPIMDWNYLTVEQAAVDFHHIVELFKSVYSNKWISYGASKNGDSALFHKRFYPDDVDATVAKVAPISFAVEDPRYDEFLANVGTLEIRDKIKQLQVELLENRNDILPLIRNYIDNSNLTFSISDGVILEFEALEYQFSFWQFGTNDISSVPDTGQTAQDLFGLFSGWLDIYSDEYLNYIAPFYYQMYTELGYYRLIDDHLSHLMVDLENPSYSIFAPEGITLNFSSSTMVDVNNWLQTDGDNIIYIYGEIDPWTAGAIESTGSTNSIKIIQPGANHSISLASLNEKELVFTTIENWLDLDIDPNISSINMITTQEEELLLRIHNFEGF